jgi:hypothetical protein
LVFLMKNVVPWCWCSAAVAVAAGVSNMTN